MAHVFYINDADVAFFPSGNKVLSIRMAKACTTVTIPGRKQPKLIGNKKDLVTILGLCAVAMGLFIWALVFSPFRDIIFLFSFGGVIWL